MVAASPGFWTRPCRRPAATNPDCSTTNSPIFGDDWRNGGNVVVDMLQDPLPWAGTPPASNVSTLLSWFDGQCDGSRELYALGRTPIEGILRSAHQYLAAGWASGWRNGNYCTTGGPALDHAAALDDRDPACRNVNVILLTDGDETCNGTATTAAAALFNTGITRAGKTWRVRTHVINFAGGTQASTDAIADFGDDGIDQTPNSANSYFANNEATLAQALSSIIAGAIRPEVCNNLDDNCNGCSDEGYRKFCNRGKTPVADPTATGQCCSWTTTPQRDACLTRYNATITGGNPTGDLFELPCWNPATDGASPQTKWLCVDPREICDDADNNCNATCTGAPPNVVCGFQNLASPPNAIDESFNKCGTPLACPSNEICDGRDNNCDNIIDNAAGSGVPFSLPGCTPCVPTAEVCDGCDNDCDGTADNGTFTQTCGFTPPANCAGNQSCLAPVAVPRGTCLPGFPRSRYGTCANNPQTEICDGIDNNCNGQIDEGIPPTACDIPGTPPPTIVYKTTFPPSQCVRGTIPCGGTCSGWVGPSSEICDGIDNDCNGVVDDNVPGVGNPCGSAAGQCRKGNTACVGGQLVCQGGQQPQPEVCNGLDDDCDGTPDDAPLGDAPANSACWNRPPTGCSPVCSHQNLQWCPPPSATCTTRGTLTTPCATGNLVCDGVNRWKCVGGQEPGIEVCDGIDNNCNGQIDEGITGPPVGLPCGPTEGECEPGRNVCRAGRIECDGGIGPTPEICDGKDNDCDTVIDDGIDVGGPCTAPYDATLYPGDRTKGECKPGTLVCNQGCVGGTGPVPEVCDGKDNDCDGAIDESGPRPDGIDGTADPNDPNRTLGDPCGVNIGECRQGRLGCVAGRVLCTGTIGPQPEQCDCKDNDCNGSVDDQVDGGSPLCGGDRRCAQVAAGVCQCAGPCRGGEFPCPQGLSCQSVPISGSTERAELCVNDPCGNCATKTVNNPTTNQPECGPMGGLPLCVCQGTAGCRNPCFNVQCGDEQRCATQGPAAGTCQPDTNCNFFGCQSGNACHNGSCVPNPCSPNPCATNEVCKPNADFTAHRCEGTCANVTCPAGQECKGGVCTPNGCGQACPPGQFCFPPAPSDAGAEAGTDSGAEASTDAGVGTCGPTRCSTDSGPACADGRFCNPITGGCEDDPAAAWCVRRHRSAETASVIGRPKPAPAAPAARAVWPAAAARAAAAATLRPGPRAARAAERRAAAPRAAVNGRAEPGALPRAAAVALAARAANRAGSRPAARC